MEIFGLSHAKTHAKTRNHTSPTHYDSAAANDDHTDRNTLVFHLKIACVCRLNLLPGMMDPCELSDHVEGTSGSLVWVPQGEQGEVKEFRRNPPMPTNLNIVLAKLWPGQEIDVEMYAVFKVSCLH